MNREPVKEFSSESGIPESLQGKGSEVAHLSIEQVQANPVLHDIIVIGGVPITVRAKRWKWVMGLSKAVSTAAMG